MHKLKTSILLAALLCFAGLAAKADTVYVTNVVYVTNSTTISPSTSSELSSGISKIWSIISTNGLTSASNYLFDAYATYAPNAKDKIGGGILVAYNLNNYVAPGLELDYLGKVSLVSGNVSLKLPIHIGSYLPSSWTWGTNMNATPFVLAGAGTPLSGSSSTVATILDAGAAIQFGHLWGGAFNVMASYGQWDNAGDESGKRYHFGGGWSIRF